MSQEAFFELEKGRCRCSNAPFYFLALTHDIEYIPLSSKFPLTKSFMKQLFFRPIFYFNYSSRF